MNNIYLIIGESGSGKTSIVNHLEQRYGFTSVQSYTTRPPRYESETGHTFVTEKEFDNLQNIVAFTEFCGYRYCATQEQIDNSDLYVIDVNGVNAFKELYKGSKDINIIYLRCGMQERMKRIENRDGFDKALERVKHDIMAFRGADTLADRIFSTDYVDVELVANYVYEYIRKCENG